MAVLLGAAAEKKCAAWLGALPADEAALGQAAIDQLLALSPACDLRWAYGGPFVYAFGKIFAFVARNRANGLHVGLAFGAQLEDPHRLLSGTKLSLIRHYLLRSPEDLEREAYFELLGQQLDIAQRAAAQGQSGWSGQVKKAKGA